MDLRQNHGAALPIVLVFSVFALIVAVVYVAAQYTIARPFLVAPAKFQALCNARSGVWKGMDLMSRSAPDTLARINTLDSMFNKKLFGAQTEAITAHSASALAVGDSPLVVAPVSSDSFGNATLSLSYMSCFKALSSSGRFRNVETTVRVLLGGKLYSSPDTVCYLKTPGAPEGGNVTGKIVAPQQDSGGERMQDLAALVAYYRALLLEKTDTTMPAAPLTVQTSDQARAIPDVVGGPLFIMTGFGPCEWKGRRRCIVTGDIQISGSAAIEDLELVTTGNVSCADDCRLRNVSVFAEGGLTIGDRAVFSGNALTLSTILVCKNGRIEDKSVMVSYGESKPPQTDTVKTLPQAPISVSLSQNAWVDGVVIASGNPGTIKTDKTVIVRGVLWASGSIAHQGTLYGILRANTLTDISALTTRTVNLPGTPPAPLKNTLTGAIVRLPDVTEYPWPFFFGRPFIVRWEE